MSCPTTEKVAAYLLSIVTVKVRLSRLLLKTSFYQNQQDIATVCKLYQKSKMIFKVVFHEVVYVVERAILKSNPNLGMRPQALGRLKYNQQVLQWHIINHPHLTGQKQQALVLHSEVFQLRFSLCKRAFNWVGSKLRILFCTTDMPFGTQMKGMSMARAMITASQKARGNI